MVLSFGLLAAAALLALAGPAGAAPSRADAAAARSVIERQLDAFARDDWAEAFSYAGPGVRGAFKTPERFAEMVRGGYPMVWRPRQVAFLGAVDAPGGLAHRLAMVGPDGAAWRVTYLLRPVDGAWRIEAVTLERAPDAVA